MFPPQSSSLGVVVWRKQTRRVENGPNTSPMDLSPQKQTRHLKTDTSSQKPTRRLQSNPAISKVDLPPRNGSRRLKNAPTVSTPDHVLKTDPPPRKQTRRLEVGLTRSFLVPPKRFSTHLLVFHTTPTFPTPFLAPPIYF
jgi:hypothetical protein